MKKKTPLRLYMKVRNFCYVLQEGKGCYSSIFLALVEIDTEKVLSLIPLQHLAWLSLFIMLLYRVLYYILGQYLGTSKKACIGHLNNVKAYNKLDEESSLLMRRYLAEEPSSQLHLANELCLFTLKLNCKMLKDFFSQEDFLSEYLTALFSLKLPHVLHISLSIYFHCHSYTIYYIQRPQFINFVSFWRKPDRLLLGCFINSSNNRR